MGADEKAWPHFLTERNLPVFARRKSSPIRVIRVIRGSISDFGLNAAEMRQAGRTPKRGAREVRVLTNGVLFGHHALNKDMKARRFIRMKLTHALVLSTQIGRASCRERV